MDVAYKLGTAKQTCPEWLIALPKNKLPQPARFAFPISDQSKVITPINNGLNNLKKCTFEQSQLDNPQQQQLNRRALVIPEQLRANGSTNGNRGRISIVRTGGKIQRQVISWSDAPEDILFISTEATK